MQEVYIHDIACISAAGIFSLSAGKISFEKAHHVLREDMPVFTLSPHAEKLLQQETEKKTALAKKSRTIQLAYTALQLIDLDKQKKTLLNIGSSRGNSDLWEKNHIYLLREGHVMPSSSPETTQGSIASSLMAHLHMKGIALDHSITCGSGLQALANSIAWLRSGMAQQALAGGTEAPLTPFTLMQFKALGVYSKEKTNQPSRPLAVDKKQSYLCLGEGAGMALLSTEPGPYTISGVGFGCELPGSLSGISKNGDALQEAMKNACAEAKIERPDLIIAHAPGTIKGDQAEMQAILQCFGENHPEVSTNKFLCGHSLGASGMLSIAQAIAHIENQDLEIPYPYMGMQKRNTSVKKVLINATGFGGIAISLILEKNELFRRPLQ